MRTLFFKESRELFLMITVAFLLFFYLTKNKISVFIYVIIIFSLLYFYRIPNRIVEKNDNIVSPSDGTIIGINKNDDNSTTISIFLSPFDVHMQYIPYDGKIIKCEYKKGNFNPAFLLQKSDNNESNTIHIQTKRGIIKVKQIAGQIARRIVNWKNVGDIVTKGDIYGMIKLSSRVNITLPSNIIVKAKIGDKLKGSITTF